MNLRSFRQTRTAAALAVAAIALSVIGLPAPAAQAASYPNISGDGSSFAYPAIDQWSKDVSRRGININYTPDGSAAGRSNYAQNQADFAGTDIQYLAKGDPFAGGTERSALAYSFVPIVAGGTSFPYNLKVGRRQITDLRLSGLTIAKIFTGRITNWADKAITKDYGAQLPSKKITVVTRSDGSGASYQFTRYLSKTYTSLWDSFCGSHNGPSRNCGPTQFFPGFRGAQQRNGSDQVANFVSSSYGEGSIAYNEYSYAINRQQPVVKLRNAAGYYVLPSDSNVAIALLKAEINKNENSVEFLIQNLDKVYGDKDPRTYPVSSYSYLVVPRDRRAGSNGPPPRFNAGKGKTLSTWLNYVLCGAQQSAGALGYSPLPVNLVQGGFAQVLHIPGHVGIPDQRRLTNCNNPTYSNGVNKLTRNAKFPSPCDKVGAPLNCTVRNGRAVSNGQQAAGAGGDNRRNTGSGDAGAPGGGGGSAGGGAGGGGSGGTAGGGTAGGGGTLGGASTGPGAGANNANANANADPIAAANSGNGGASAQELSAQTVSLRDDAPNTALFSILTGLEILAALLAPALLGIWLQRRRRA